METTTKQGELLPTAIASTNAKTPEALLSKAAAGEGLTGVEVGLILGRVKSRISEAASNPNPDHFHQWSQALDPGGVAWRFEGTGRNRRYYRDNLNPPK